MKKLTLLLAAMLTGQAVADVAQVNIWSPYPGRSADMYEAAIQAKAIHEKLGASVTISTDQDLNMHYVTVFESWADYGKFQSDWQNSKEWDEWWAARLDDPSAELVQTFHVNNPNPAESKPVSMVFSWDVDRGHTPEFIERAQRAIPIHARLGASASINVDDVGDVHYEMTFDSWEAWGKYMARQANDEEWNAFVEEASQRQIATLTKVWRLNVMQFD